MLEYEHKWQNLGKKRICGVDEAGRGPLAGPVVVCACVMPTDDIIEGVNDSKLLSEKERERLYYIIKEKAIAFEIVAIDNDEIDRINILQATKKAMTMAIEKIQPDVALIDAVKLLLECDSESIIKGDQKSYSIACASILAKVTRDEMMVEYSKKYANYSFEKHKGYGTVLHFEALKKYGECEIHRKSFLKNFHESEELQLKIE